MSVLSCWSNKVIISNNAKAYKFQSQTHQKKPPLRMQRRLVILIFGGLAHHVLKLHAFGFLDGFRHEENGEESKGGINTK